MPDPDQTETPSIHEIPKTTFLVLYKRYAAFAEGKWVVRLWDLVTKKLIVEDLHYQRIVSGIKVPRTVPMVAEGMVGEIQMLIEGNIPFVVEKGCCADWGAWGWNLDMMREEYGQCEVDVSFGRRKCDDKTEKMLLGDFIGSFEVLSRRAEELRTAPPYLRAWEYRKNDLSKGLEGGYTPPSWATDYFEKMKEEDRPEFKWLFIGPRGVRTPLHIDPCLTNAWMAQIQGTKHWKFIPPTDIHHLVDSNGFADMSRVDYSRFPTAHQAQVLEIDLHPGQILFIPQGWAHDVTTTEHGLAITHNYIDKQAYVKVVRQACLKHLLG